jgi:hypothetical protein
VSAVAVREVREVDSMLRLRRVEIRIGSENIPRDVPMPAVLSVRVESPCFIRTRSIRWDAADQATKAT